MTDELEALLAAATPALYDLDRRLKRWEHTEGEAWLSVKLSALRQLSAIATAARHRTQALRAAEERVAVLTAEREGIVERCAQIVDAQTPAPAGGLLSHTNSMRVVLIDAARAIRTLTSTSKDPSHAE